MIKIRYIHAMVYQFNTQKVKDWSTLNKESCQKLIDIHLIYSIYNSSEIYVRVAIRSFITYRIINGDLFDNMFQMVE